jgi:hypothetical protein
VSLLAPHLPSLKVHAAAALLLLMHTSAHAQAPQEGEPAPSQEGEPAPPPPAAPPQAPAPDQEDGAPLPDPESGDVSPAPAPTVEQAPAPAPESPESAPPPAPSEPPELPENAPPMTFLEAMPEPQEEPGAAATEATCDPAEQDCICPKNWGCWELLYATKGTILGAKITLTYSSANAPEEIDAGFITFYATEHYATRNNLTVHVQGFAGIGGGTAHNEGSLGGALDVGWRGTITETSGPFVRVGVSGMMTGHRAFFLSLFEPFHGRAGYQLLDGDRVLEIGMTNGFIPVGYFEPGKHARRDLSRSKELGGYLAIHNESYRADASFMHVFDPEAGKDRDDVEIARAMYCDYRLGIVLCADGLFTRGEARQRGRERMTNALYFGITLGLSP